MPDKAFHSNHFQLEEIASGVHSALAILGGAAGSNSAIIDLGGRTLVVDSFTSPMAAQDLKKAVEELYGRPAAYVINTHSHADHWFGNQVFEDSTIVSSTHARQEMLRYITDIDTRQRDIEKTRAALAQEEEKLKNETNPQKRSMLELSVSRMRNSLETLGMLELCFPDQTFEGKLVFHGSKRDAVLLGMGGGHTPGDSVLLLPVDKIAFIGDLGFFKRQPYLGDSDIPTWLGRLDELKEMDVVTYQPGHGPLGTRVEIDLLRDYLVMIEDFVTRAIQRGEKIETVAQTRLPAPFDAWSPDGLPNPVNVQYFYKRLQPG
jgi:cyclase